MCGWNLPLANTDHIHAQLLVELAICNLAKVESIDFRSSSGVEWKPGNIPMASSRCT